MKQLFFLWMALLLSGSSVFSQKVVYDDHAEKRPIGAFHAIEVSSGIEVIISKGDKEELAVSVGNQEYINQVRTVVEGGVLKISRSSDDWKFWNRWKNWRVKVYVSYTNIDALKANSGGSVNGTDIKLQSLNVKLSSGGSITLSGTVESLQVDGSSGAQFHGYGLAVQKCYAEVSSGAGVQVTVDKEISAKANSGGSIRFKGEGLIRDINVNSGGSVKRQNNS